MDELISRQAAINVLEERLQANGYSNVALISELNRSIGYLMQLPSAPIIDTVKHGRWIEHHEPFTWMGYTTWTCSKCDYECGYEKEIGFRTPCCPNCGALMDGVEE